MIPLKDQYFNPDFYKKLTRATKAVYPELEENKFYASITDSHNSLELMGRLKLCSLVLYQQLPLHYPSALPLLLEIASEFTGFVGMIFPDFVARYGLKHFEISIDALKKLTVYSSSEFGIRPFLRYYPDETVKTMVEWSLHENEHIRRLASEGMRPFLPWTFKLSEDLNYPEVSKQILSNLNNDKSLYVRKSVANHLNDLTKTHSDFAIDLIHSWDSNQTHTSWIIKKGLRTLIKNGDKRVFAFLGYSEPTLIKVSNLELEKKEIIIGGETVFSFEVKNNSDIETALLIDFSIRYVKKTGTSTKVFKLREIKIDGKQNICVSKKISFQQLSTRTHYPGKHKLEILINGEIKAQKYFTIR